MLLCIYITKIYPFPRSVCKRLNIFFLELFTKKYFKETIYFYSHSKARSLWSHSSTATKTRSEVSAILSVYRFRISLPRCALFLLPGLYGRQTKRSFHSINQLHDYKPSVASTSAVFVGACWLARCVKPNRWSAQVQNNLYYYYRDCFNNVLLLWICNYDIMVGVSARDVLGFLRTTVSFISRFGPTVVTVRKNSRPVYIKMILFASEYEQYIFISLHSFLVQWLTFKHCYGRIRQSQRKSHVMIF